MPRNPTIPRVCEQCGQSFLVYPSALKKDPCLYCSLACKGLASRRPLAVRFWSKVSKTDTCWVWTGALATGGYGLFSKTHGKHTGAHRMAWELTHGPIPDGLFVCHTCDNRRCVNPAHHFLGTHDDNMLDMKTKGRAASGDRSPARMRQASRQSK